jgi:bacterioferritin-associated ferredoxin
MYVCVCRAVTDRDVKTAIEDGADTVAKVTAACRAGGDCGACHAMIDDMIDEHQSVRRLPVVRVCAA